MGQWFGKWGGPAVSGVSAAFGFHDDVTNQDKTNGEAIAHNAAVFGVGFAPAVVIGVVGVTPVGWAVVGVAAAGTGLAAAAEYAYRVNFGELQDGLDAVGRGLDLMTKGVVDKALRRKSRESRKNLIYF